VDNLCICGDGTEGSQASCVGNKAAPNCDKTDKKCVCSLTAKTSCAADATKKSAPTCFKNGINAVACSCGAEGTCKDGSLCTKDVNGNEKCTPQCPTACNTEEKCDTFHKICRCGEHPSCANFSKAPDCKCTTDTTTKKTTCTCQCGSNKACASGKTCDIKTKKCVKIPSLG